MRITLDGYRNRAEGKYIVSPIIQHDVGETLTRDELHEWIKQLGEVRKELESRVKAP